MAKQRKSDRMMATAFASIRAFIGITTILLVLFGTPGPLFVQSAVNMPNKPGAGPELSVQFLRYQAFTKSSPDPHAFDNEAALWTGVPEIVFVLIAMVIPCFVGWRVGLRIGRSRRNPGTTATDEAIRNYADGEPPK